MDPSQQPYGPGPDQGGQHREVNYTAPAFTDDSTTPTHHPDYAFIMDPAATSRPSLINLKLGNSLLSRLAIVLGGLLVLLILFTVGKSLLGGNKSNAAALLTVTQNQTLLIHLATVASQQQGTTTITHNSSATISATVTSAQAQLKTYMSNVGLKLSASTPSLHVSISDDAQLAAAASAGNYDATYKTVVTTALANYQQALKQAYAVTTGHKGRALLNEEFNGAVLLSQQLAS